MKTISIFPLVSSIALIAGLSGCATTQNTGAQVSTSGSDQKVVVDHAREAKLEAEIAQLRSDLNASRRANAATDEAAIDPAMADLPPAANPGECYARVFIPPTFETKTETLESRQASERVEIIPAQYGWAEDTVVVKEASERLEVIPATYDWVEEKVLVTEESERLVEVPATYETITEKVLVRPTTTTWKKGRGPIEKVDHATGEIMCLIEVPAQYKTVSKRVLKSAAGTKKVTIPAEYKTIKRRVLVEGPKTRTIEIPAEYKTVKVKKLVSPAKEQRIEIPAEYTTVTKRAQVTDGHLEWRPILCETNASPTLVSDVQRALTKAGYNPGDIDGILGRDTMGAVNTYQKDKGLASGQLTLETIKHLGVRI